MSEPARAVASRSVPKQAAADPATNRLTELKVSGHLMTLEAGLFCVFQPPGSPTAGPNGLPGVRLSLPPAPMQRPDSVSISTFRPDGWMNGGDGAALIRVAEGPAQVLVTVYQAPGSPAEAAPRLQVMRLTAEPVPGQAQHPQGRGAAPALAPDVEAVAHVQRTGDVGAQIGEWVGVRGSKLWIEGFGITPRREIAPEDIEYQAVLGRGWLSPWVEGGKFCGSRGMALPLLGVRIRLKGSAAATYDCRYAATFVDGTNVGPVAAGEACEAESLAGLEAFQVILRRRDGAAADKRTTPAATPPGASRPAGAPRKSVRRTR